MIQDYFIYVLRSLKNRKIRSYLTIIGIFIGITAVVALISIGQGLKNTVNEEFGKIGKDRIIIAAGAAFFGPGADIGTGEPITEDDVEVIEKTRGVKTAFGAVVETAKIEFSDEVEYLQVLGIPTEKSAIQSALETGIIAIDKGRVIKEGDKYKAIIGSSIAEDIFEKEVNVRDKILINDQEFKVVGILEATSVGLGNDAIRIPKETARELFDEPEELNTIFAQSLPTENVSEVAENIKKDLRKFRDVEEDEEDFTVETAQQTIDTINNIIGVVNVFLIGVAAISLVIGGVGIMNTMYTAVLERRREIGVMKSIGARNGQILLFFLMESGFLGLVGGIVGLLFGLGISKLGEIIAVAMGVTIFRAYVGLPLVLGALLFSFLVGAISGALPARQASLLKPVDALRK